MNSRLLALGAAAAVGVYFLSQQEDSPIEKVSEGGGSFDPDRTEFGGMEPFPDDHPMSGE